MPAYTNEQLALVYVYVRVCVCVFFAWFVLVLRRVACDFCT